jgi:phospholipase/lecithinase/hemolysin
VDRADFLHSIGIQPARTVIIGPPYNDGGNSAAAVTAAASALYQKYATHWPGMPVWHVFLPDRGFDYMSGTGQPELSAAAKAAAVAAPNVVAYIDGITGQWSPGGACPPGLSQTDVTASFLTGNGKEDALAGNGNCDLFRSADAVHPTYVGHDYFAIRIAALISESMPV